MLRNDDDPNRDEKITEMTSNLIERYYSNIEKGMTEEEAYKDAIKYFGTSNSETVRKSNNASKNVSWIEIVYICSLVIGGLAIFIKFVNTIACVCLIAVSMIAYGVAYAFTMDRCNKFKNDDYDIEKYRMELRNAFKYLKYAMIIWMIPIALIISQLLASIAQVFGGGSFFTPIGAVLLLAPLFRVLYFAIYFVAFGASLYGCFIVGRKILAKVMMYYEKETGSDEFRVVIPDKKPRKARKRANPLNVWNIIYTIVFTIAITFLVAEGFHGYNYTSLFNYSNLEFAYRDAWESYIADVFRVLTICEAIIGLGVLVTNIVLLSLKKLKAHRIVFNIFAIVSCLFFYVSQIVFIALNHKVLDFGHNHEVYVVYYSIMVFLFILTFGLNILFGVKYKKSNQKALA